MKSNGQCDKVNNTFDKVCKDIGNLNTQYQTVEQTYKQECNQLKNNINDLKQKQADTAQIYQKKYKDTLDSINKLNDRILAEKKEFYNNYSTHKKDIEKLISDNEKEFSTKCSEAEQNLAKQIDDYSQRLIKQQKENGHRIKMEVEAQLSKVNQDIQLIEKSSNEVDEKYTIFSNAIKAQERLMEDVIKAFNYTKVSHDQLLAHHKRYCDINEKQQNEINVVYQQLLQQNNDLNEKYSKLDVRCRYLSESQKQLVNMWQKQLESFDFGRQDTNTIVNEAKELTAKLEGQQYYRSEIQLQYERASQNVTQVEAMTWDMKNQINAVTNQLNQLIEGCTEVQEDGQQNGEIEVVKQNGYNIIKQIKSFTQQQQQQNERYEEMCVQLQQLCDSTKGNQISGLINVKEKANELEKNIQGTISELKDKIVQLQNNNQ